MASETWRIASHVLLLLATPPLFLGIIARVKALFAGRRGPPLFQVYYDLFKLFRKGMVVSQTTSVFFRIAPPVIFFTLVAAGLFLPLTGASPVHFEGDFILFAYLLALARFFLILSALDCGSSFEGMGASREAAFGAFTELAFFLGLIVLKIASSAGSLTDFFHWEGGLASKPVLLLLFVAFFLILLTENSRIPIDDPNTHLELTMIHEVMILDTSGPALGLILYGSAIKLFLFLGLTASLLPPVIPLSLRLIGIAVAVGVVESANARLRLVKIPQLLVANFIIMVFALLVVTFGGGGK